MNTLVNTGCETADNWDISDYRRLLEEDSASKPLKSSEKSSIIKRCMQEAWLQKQRITERFGPLGAEAYIEKLGFHIIEEAPELMPSFMYMGILEPDTRTIRLNRTVMELAESYMKALTVPDSEQIRKFRDIVLFHELFHGIEEETPGIYTREVKTRKRILGIFSITRKVESASEIGAVHFSRLMAEADFSPLLYTRYLLAATNQDTEVNDERRTREKGRRT